MKAFTVIVLATSFLALLALGCPAIIPDPPDPDSNCPADDPRVGQTANFRSYWHDIRGTARIVDDCTIVIEDFYYDGGGLDVRIVGFSRLGQLNGVPLTTNIKRESGYHGETMNIPLPQDVTLDDVGRISVTCVSYNINFGDATFE